MLSWRKAYLFHHPAEQCTKSRHCNNKLHQIAYRKFKNPIANYRVEQQPFHAPPKKEIQRCNKPEVIRSSQCFQTWLDLLYKDFCIRNRIEQFLIFRIGLDGNIKQIVAHKFNAAEVPADPTKIADHFLKLLLTFSVSSLVRIRFAFRSAKYLFIWLLLKNFFHQLA